MAQSSTRIRCLVCNKLVLRHFDPNDSDKPYAVIPLNLRKKRGCVCVDCVEFYHFQESYGAFYDTEHTTHTCEAGNNCACNASTDLAEPNKDETPTATCETDFSINSNRSETSSVYNNNETTSEDEEIENLKKIFQKYDCLEYSLDSFAKTISRTVFGQKESVKKVVYALYMNQMLNFLEETGLTFDNLNMGGSPGFKRRHILLIGDTGVGKTLLATTAPRVMGLIHSVSNVTPITAAGYVGEDLIAVVERLYDAAGEDIDKAQNGVIILDEIDKKRHEPSTSGKDINGKAVQQELLKLLEPSTVWIKKHSIPFKTDNLTIIMMGAFVGLDEIIKQRTNQKKIGFACEENENETNSNVLPEDLIEYGFIPEFIGRIPCICQLNKLTVNVASDIIYGLLEKYNLLFKVKGYEFYFNPFLVQKIAEKVANSSMGARNVETCVDEILQPVLWNIFPSHTGGKCEIFEDGSARITRVSPIGAHRTEIITTPSINAYTEDDDELEVALL